MGLSIVIAGGGTGGHLYPGLAVARALLARVADATVTFVGTAAGIESRVIPREGFPLAVIRSAGLKGKSIGAVLRGLLLLPLSAWDAWRTLSRLRPAVVIGVGGYSSGPVVLLAALRGGLKTVLFPKENEKDLADIPDNVKKGLELIPISTVDEALKRALVRPLVPIKWDEEEHEQKLRSEKKDGDRDAVTTH